MGRTRTGQHYKPQDDYFKKAKKEGFVARSIFKLEELDKKFRIFKPGQKILDLGCAPGSWLQYASKRIGSKGTAFGIDIEPVRVSEKNVATIVASIYDIDSTHLNLQKLLPFDVIQSDAMTKTTGIAESDCARSVALVERAIYLAQNGFLKAGGNFVAKVFEGPDFTPFYVKFKQQFKDCSVNHVAASREGSREVYIVGKLRG